MNELTRKRLFQGVLIFFLLIGVFFRFYNLNWDSGALLHPDEYGFANTLTRLSFPSSLGDYFNTRLSPLSPYNKYDEAGVRTADGPDNRMRWGQLPITLIRLTAEIFRMTGYSEARMTGRVLSALADVGSLLLLVAIGIRLFRDRTVALLAAALSALAVMQIQQSHFATSDNFAVLFVMLTIFAGARIASEPSLERGAETGVYRVPAGAFRRFILFGIFLGMATACKINQVVAAIVILPAAFLSIADVRLSRRGDFREVFGRVFGLCCLAAICALISFRIFQPMSFRAASGDTSFFTWRPNPDWLDSMAVSAIESSGLGGGPPAEQWAHRLPIIFPLVNMIGYGMGLPLGLTAWALMGWAFVRIVRMKEDWRALLIPFGWAFVFFVFMGTRFVKSIRYMLPVYPMLCLIAAWGLIRMTRSARKGARIVGRVWLSLALVGTGTWAAMFAAAIYAQPHSRVEAVRWMYREIPAAIQFESGGADGEITAETKIVRVFAADSVEISPDNGHDIGFSVEEAALVGRLRFAKAEIPAGTRSRIGVRVLDGSGATLMEEMAALTGTGAPVEILFPLTDALPLSPGFYTLRLSADTTVRLRRNVIANESWDEGLPFRLDGFDPFGQLYTGITNEIRWSDSESKKEMLLDVLERADYLVLPSQRSIWSAVRIPKTYPMTLRYYEALFDGSLGFTKAASFSRPFRLGDVYISDLVGEIRIGAAPELPIYNLRLLAAEEAFSVYDHPPVWIFRKTDAFSIEKATEILDSVDLSAVKVQGPREAEWDDGYAAPALF